MTPILQAWRGWPDLLTAARGWPVLRATAAAPHDRDLHLLLQAPVTLAWWIATFTPELVARDDLDLVVVGIPGGPSSTDEGRPYQLLPLLLGRPAMRVNVTVLVGSTRPEHAPLVAHPAPAASLGGRDALYPALRSRDTIMRWLDLCGERLPDACVLMQPNFDERVDFWHGLRALHAARVPVGCFARSRAEAERDAWMLAAYGYDVQAAPQQNPWAQHWPELRGYGAWGAVTWRFAPTHLPPSGHVVDHARLARGREAQRFLRHEFEVWNPLQYIGQRLDDPALGLPDVGQPIVGLPDHHALSLATGEVWQLEPDGAAPVIGSTKLPSEVLASYPPQQAGSFERVLWAVDVYRDQFRPREAAAIEALGLARVEQLKDGISQAFQGRASAAELAAFETYYLGGEPPAPATAGSGPLFEALRRRDWKRADELIAQRPGLVNAQDEDGRTPLFYAMLAGHNECAARFLDLGADPDRCDHEGFAIVHDMAKREEIEPLELLKRYGANLDLPTGLGMTPALLALRYRRWAVLAYLVERGADLMRATLPGASVAEQYGEVDDLPRVLRAAIDRRLGRRSVIPIVPVERTERPFVR